MTRRTLLIAVTLFAIVGWIAPRAQAGFIMLVDFTDAASSSASLGGTWNAVDETGAAAGTLQDTGGNTLTGVSLALANIENDFGSDLVFDNGSPAGTPWSGDNDWVDEEAVVKTVGGFDSQSATATVTIAGLPTGSVYGVDLVAVRSTDGDRLGNYKANGSFADSSPDGQDFNAYSDGWQNGSILSWDSVALDSNDELVLSIDNDGGFNGVYATALRIVEIPEPATLVLLGLGGAVMLGGCRRRA